MTKYERNNRKLKKLEEKYYPQKYFAFQRRKLKNSLKTSINNTINYINRNISKCNSNELFKKYKDIDFNNKQLYVIETSILISLITGTVVTLLINFSEKVIKSSESNSNESMISIIGGIFFISIIGILVVWAIFFLLKKEYCNEYDLFIAPYERKKTIKLIEKEINNPNYKNIL